jgi:hypothetical protein
VWDPKVNTENKSVLYIKKENDTWKIADDKRREKQDVWDAIYYSLMSLLISSIDKKYQEMIKTIINPKTVYKKLNTQ